MIIVNLKELIAELQKYPENTNVEIYASYDYNYAYAGGNIQEVYYDKEINTIQIYNNEG